jgi:hypothetical protein
VGEDAPEARKAATLFQALKMVLSAFIGIRKRGKQGEQEIRVTPVQLVIIGIITAAAFVFTVASIVRLVLR